MNVLVVVDMQNDFIDGALGTVEAMNILPNVLARMITFDGLILATRDTHQENYLETQEGRRLPVVHCVEGTHGWEIRKEVQELLSMEPINKPTFGSVILGDILKQFNDEMEPIESVTLIGLCTDICVISNAMLLKAYLPEAAIKVDAVCCAGVSPESHKLALDAMKACQIEILNEELWQTAPDSNRKQ